MKRTSSIFAAALCLLLSFGSAQERASYFGVGLDYVALGFEEFVALPTLQYGLPIALTPTDENSEFRVTLATILVINELQLELLYKGAFSSDAFYYVGGGVDALVYFLGPFSGFDVGVHGTLGFESTLSNNSNRLFIEAQPTVSLQYLVLRTRAGVNFYF